MMKLKYIPNLKGDRKLKKYIGLVSYLSILILLVMYIWYTHSIEAKYEAPDNNITWQFTNITTTASTEEFEITEYADKIKLNNIKQSTTSESKGTITKIEYRLLKLDDNGSFIDTGIYKYLESKKGKILSTHSNLYGSISPGTYKIKIINSNGDDSKVNSERTLRNK